MFPVKEKVHLSLTLTCHTGSSGSLLSQEPGFSLFGLCSLSLDQTLCKRQMINRRMDRLRAPLSLELQTVNCTAFRIQWKIPHRHNTITGYRVFYAEMRDGRYVNPTMILDVPLSAHTLLTDVVIGGLDMGTQYGISVAAYDGTTQGRPSMPRSVSTASQGVCMPPSAPTQAEVVALSDTELALSWQQSESQGSSPVLHFLVAYIRPEMDSEWTIIREPVESNSMVFKGLIPQTKYQFIIRSVNQYGISHPSPVSHPIRTLAGPAEVSSGDEELYTDDVGFAVDSDYDVFVDELQPFPVMKNLHSQLRSPSSASANGHVIYRKTILHNTPVLKNTPELQISDMPFNKVWTLTTTTPSISPTLSKTAPPITRPLLSKTALPTTSPIITSWKGMEPRVYDVSCDETVCPPDSFCSNDYDSGGSRCHCNLGHRGNLCSEGVLIRFPRFYGFSHMTFEPLKNSYQSFQITLEFKADSEDGLLLYCGENERSRGDFISLALVHKKLHYRFNCGTGAAQIISHSSVVIGQWHTVTLFREGVNGWLQLDSNTPVSGHSLGHYSKITFRTPLFVGGAPSVYWLMKTVGTNHGFHGCVQRLSINGRYTELRPWPQGHALSGADIGECSTSVCDEVVCEHSGVCYPTRADSYICLCPLGYRGVHCEESFVLSLPRFSESVQSFASAPWPQHTHSYLSFMEFHITFKPTNQDGTLLYSHDEHSHDFLSIVLVGGAVEFHFDCGTGAAIIRSEQPVSMNVWHDLRASRTAKSGILQVDNQWPVEGSAEGAFTQIKCSSPLYIGGVPDYDSTKGSAGVARPFSGDIQRITLNDREVAMVTGQVMGVNVMNTPHPCVENPCANGGTCRPKRDEYECDCILGYDGTHCQKECGNYCYNSVTEAIEIPQFTGRSYLTYDSQEILKRVSGLRTSVFLRFKSSSKDGLLLWRGENPGQAHTDYLSLGLQNGTLIFSYDLGSGAVFVVVNGAFSDGKWHRVKAVRDGQSGKLTVDDYGVETGQSPGKMRQLNVNGELYIGGMKEVALHTSHQYLAGLVGCVSHFTLSTDYHVSLVEDAVDGKNINTCSN
ncbi:pikachurin [Neoarius graeffei]|uniref:pikachurin n=1 Tax=Neoarius graeffei TaxID=443677 RepID=UPI00298CE45C|nr:pikachurin [Neoarius graeffei]